MPWKKPSYGYLSPAIERAVKHALVHGESYESLEQRFSTNERLFRESWAFWSNRVPKDLDEASLQRWIYEPFPVPKPTTTSE